MGQSGEFKSATICLIPPTYVQTEKTEPASLVPQNRPTVEHAREADEPRKDAQSTHAWLKMVTNEE